MPKYQPHHLTHLQMQATLLRASTNLSPLTIMLPSEFQNWNSDVA